MASLVSCDGLVFSTRWLSARDVIESVWLSREIKLCLERVNVILRGSEVVELEKGIAGDSGAERKANSRGVWCARDHLVTA
jgi:hypothetical protein